MTTTDHITTTTTTVLQVDQEAERLLASLAELRTLDVAFAIEQAGGDAECVSADYPPDDADQAVESADSALTAEVNASLRYLAEHGPAMALAFHTIRRLDRRVYQVVEDTFGSDVDGAVLAGLRVSRRLNAAHALADQVFYAHRDNYNPDSEPMPGTLPG